jgi:predicted ribosomally synthesized peptide with SipW-like signal peptide
MRRQITYKTNVICICTNTSSTAHAVPLLLLEKAINKQERRPRMKDERTTGVMDASATIAEIERLERELGAMNTKTAERDAEVEKQAARLKSRSYRTSVIATVLFTLLIFVVFSAQTYAYFTDSAQSFNNSIQSGNLDITTVAAGGSVNTEPTAIMPGTEVAKGVDVKNVGSLNSYVRAKIDISIEKAGIDQAELESLIQFNINTITTWKLHTDGYYYYVGGTNGVVGSNDTVNLFTTITFLSTMDNKYTNATITITVTTDAVQSDFNGADDAKPWDDSVLWTEN